MKAATPRRSEPLSDTARNVGSVFAYDEWQISRYVAVSYGANYARYDYMDRSGAVQPELQRDVLADRVVAPARVGIARGQRAGRGGIHSAVLRRVPAAAAHLLAALEGGHAHAGAAELRSWQSSAC